MGKQEDKNHSIDKKQYNLLTLYAPALLEKFRYSGSFSVSYDLDKPYTIQRSLFRSLDRYKDCALFHQIEQALLEKGTASPEDPEDRLLEHLVFVDFDTLFRDIGKDEKTRLMIQELFDEKKGIEISFASGIRTLVPFDKSGSMARTSRISFIDQEIKEDLDRRLCLDIDFSKLNENQLNLSKYYAYRGLYLSSGLPIQRNDFVLDEKTVIVIPDDTHEVYLRIKESGEGESNGSGEGESEGADEGESKNREFLYQEDKSKIPENSEELQQDYLRVFKEERPRQIEGINRFDGEGLMSPAYAKMITEEVCKNKKLNPKDSNNQVTSAQVRFPFTKGMLHMVDFHEFFAADLSNLSDDRRTMITELRASAEKALGHSYPSVDLDRFEVRDAYGIYRRLGEAQIILTVSMFKCKKWLRIHWDSMPPEEHQKYGGDPMRFFFDRTAHYCHCLYVTGSNLGFDRDNRTELNYQFLNTLPLTGEEFEALLENHIAYSRDVLTNENKAKKRLLQEKSAVDEESEDLENTLHTSEQQPASDPAGNDETEDDAIPDQSAMWKLALKKNRAFLWEASIRKRLQVEERSMLKDCAEGRLNVAGSTCYLSGDLMRLLLHIRKQGQDFLGLCKNGESQKVLPDHRSDPLYQSIHEMEWTACLPPKRMFVPSVPARFVDNVKFSETAALPSITLAILRNPHLSRSEDRCAVPYTNPLYDAYFSQLSGIAMTAYSDLIPMALSGADFDGDPVKIILDPIVNRGVRRSDGKYPVGVIPSVKLKKTDVPKDNIVPDTISFEMIQRTFSNRVGQISNLAVRLTREEYRGTNGSAPAKDDTLQKKLKNKSCEANIITGLEIDSVKNGLRPESNIRELESLGREIKDETKGYYFDRLKEIRKLNPGRKFPKIRQLPGIDGDSAKDKIYTIQQLRSKKFIRYDSASPAVNIDRLPGIFSEKTVNGIRNWSDQLPSDDSVLFRFERDAAWLEDIRMVYSEVSRLVTAYHAVVNRITRAHHSRKQFSEAKFDAFFMTILKMQYDDLLQVMPGTTMNVCDVRDEAYFMLYDRIAANLADRSPDAEDYPLSVMNAVNNVLNRVVGESWIYTLPENREKTLRSLLGMTDNEPLTQEEQAAFAMLTDFRERGYGLLYYALKDIASTCRADSNMALPASTGTDSSDSEFFDALYQVYQENDRKLATLGSIREKLLAKVRSELERICGGDWDTALKAVYAVYLNDSGKRAEILYRAIDPEAFVRNIDEAGGAEKC